MNMTETKTALPSKVEQEMDQWRAVGTASGPVPKSYVVFHETLARTAIRSMPLDVQRIYMEDDGWMDGMKFVHAIVERPNGALATIKWCDGQYWMEKCASGGWKYFRA